MKILFILLHKCVGHFHFSLLSASFWKKRSDSRGISLRKWWLVASKTDCIGKAASFAQLHYSHFFCELSSTLPCRLLQHAHHLLNADLYLLCLETKLLMRRAPQRFSSQTIAKARTMQPFPSVLTSGHISESRVSKLLWNNLWQINY